MLYNFQKFRIHLNWMTLADIALLHGNRFHLSLTRLAISYIKHKTEKYFAFVRHVVVLDEPRISVYEGHPINRGNFFIFRM